ncbi:hypothetical protein [Paenibacillus antibioticophila]|uniref:hypothetical protein n=1 Tax=Paenibacillus antibioticophila TaxID=1274374 RepID=UPI0005C8139B|nr:hypothetical protein [Paenibacillus antibioticophila]
MKTILLILYVIICYVIMKLLFFFLLKIALFFLWRLTSIIEEIIILPLQGKPKRRSQRTKREIIRVPKLNTYLSYNLFKHYVKTSVRQIFRVKVIDIFFILVAFHFCNELILLNAVNMTISDIISFSKTTFDYYNHSDEKFQKLVVYIVFAPAIYVTYLYLTFRVFRMERYLVPYLSLFEEIQKKIVNNINIIQRDKQGVVEHRIKEIAGGFSYRFAGGTPQICQDNYFGGFSEERDVSVVCLEKFKEEDLKFAELKAEYKKGIIKHPVLEMMIRKSNLTVSNILYSYNLGILGHEKRIFLDVSSNYELQKCRNYFFDNHNQIYKHKFTNARVIRSEALKDLSYYENKLARTINIFKEDLEEYLYCLGENNRYLELNMNKVAHVINIQHFGSHIKILLMSIIFSYFKIIRKLIV